MQQMIFSCSSSHGHRWAVPSPTAGETFRSLRVTRIQPFSSATQPLPLCRRSSFISTIKSCPHHTLVKGAFFSPSVGISEAQRCQVACPSHTASEDQSRISLKCDFKSSALPTAPYHPWCHENYPLEKGRMRFFFFWGTSEIKSTHPYKSKLLLLETAAFSPWCGGTHHSSGDKGYWHCPLRQLVTSVTLKVHDWSIIYANLPETVLE